MKIQINSLEALERLIGGDTEVEIDIRNSVVQNFTNKYLKGIAKELIDTSTAKAILTEIKTELIHSESWDGKVVLKPKYQDTIRDAVAKNVKEIVQAKVIEYAQTEQVTKEIKGYVEYYTRQQVEKITKAYIDGKVDEGIKNKLKSLI